MPMRPRTFRPALVRTTGMRDDSKAERDAFYSSSRWMRLRKAFLSANPVCIDCLAEDRVEPATIVHHRLERLHRPDLDLDEANLEALCSPCHTKRHKPKGSL
jgi:5-methylcytosine-specific restriction endonuclease McrA